MANKALYKNKNTGDLFAIEIGDDGGVVSTAGPLLTKDLNPETLDFDHYWDSEVQANIKGFELVSKLEYLELLHQNGFYCQRNQKHLF